MLGKPGLGAAPEDYLVCFVYLLYYTHPIVYESRSFLGAQVLRRRPSENPNATLKRRVLG